MTVAGEYFDRLPAWPLLRYVRAVGKVRTLEQRDSLRRAYERAKQEGTLTFTAADRLAVEWLAVHPSEIWPDWFELADAATA